MARFSDLFNSRPDAHEIVLLTAELERKYKVARTQKELYDAATGLGYSETATDTQIDLLFSTFPGEWSLYILTGSQAIVTAIQNDATIAWMNTEYPPGSGVTIRERLINRLTG